MEPRELVRFVCASADHMGRGRDPEGGVLTPIKDGAWAFCPWGQDDGHSWTEVEGVDLHSARTMRFSMPRSS
jgi:hypothetical protein